MTSTADDSNRSPAFSASHSSLMLCMLPLHFQLPPTKNLRFIDADGDAALMCRPAIGCGERILQRDVKEVLKVAAAAVTNMTLVSVADDLVRTQRGPERRNALSENGSIAVHRSCLLRVPLSQTGPQCPRIAFSRQTPPSCCRAPALDPPRATALRVPESIVRGRVLCVSCSPPSRGG
eukprot:ctg_1452.g335